MRKVLISVFALGLLYSCGKSTYESHAGVEVSGWDFRDTVVFNPAVNTERPYQIKLLLQTTDDYRYSNIWLRAEWVSPSGDTAKRNINMPLAEQSGKWIGTGPGKYHDANIVIDNSFSFGEAGEYKFYITHLMRNELIDGVRQVGLRLKEVEQ